jgi:3-dehydroquinate dehydratase-2
LACGYPRDRERLGRASGRFQSLYKGLTGDFHKPRKAFCQADEVFGGWPNGLRLPLEPVVTYNRATYRHIAGIWMANSLADMIYVLNGPNLNLLGTREPETYGHATLADVEKLCAGTAAQFGLKADCRQSNREGELVDFIHEAHSRKAAGIIINAGAYSHTSIALHDALMAVKIPTVEVHISNIYARDDFRHHSFTARAAFATLCGFGIDGYRLAINGLAARIGAKAKA